MVKVMAAALTGPLVASVIVIVWGVVACCSVLAYLQGSYLWIPT